MKLNLLILCMSARVLSCVPLCDLIDCNWQGFSVHGVLQARILEWVAIFSSRGSSRPKAWTHISCISFIGRQILYHSATILYTLSVLTTVYTREIKNVCPHTDLYTNMHSSFTYNSLRLEITLAFIRWLSQQILFIEWDTAHINKVWVANICKMWVTVKNIMLSLKSQSEDVLCDSIFVKL